MVIREIIKPDSDTYILRIPKEYLHKEIEVILLPTSSVNQREDHINANKEFEPEKYYAAAETTKQEIDNYLQNVRNEWQAL